MDIQCPSCGRRAHEVIDSRPSDTGASRWRLRRCRVCAHKFETDEHVTTPAEPRYWDPKAKRLMPRKKSVKSQDVVANRP